MINPAIGITLSRIFLTPVLVACIWYHQWIFAVATFTIAALTDLLDGFVARRYHMQTRLGQILDPIADKFLLIASLYCILIQSQLSWIVIPAVYFLIFKELLFLAVGGWLIYRYQFFIEPSRLSRAASVFEIMVVWLVLISAVVVSYRPEFGLALVLYGTVMLVIANILSLWILIRYIFIIRNYLRNDQK